MTTSEGDVVTYEVKGRVAMVTMNRPRYRNAQNSVMTYALDAAFQRAVEDAAISVIVLAGSGEHFSAGHDIGTPPTATTTCPTTTRRRCGGTTSTSTVVTSGTPARWRSISHVPPLARVTEADDRNGAGRVHCRRRDADLGVRPGGRRRRRLLRRPGGADGYPPASSISPIPGCSAHGSPKRSCSPQTVSPLSAPTRWAWSTVW